MYGTGMRIKRETDYAIRCVNYLAMRHGQIAVIGDISKNAFVPRKFLAKILQKLARAGIVTSHRGVKGGFELARGPSLINFLEVIEAIQPVEMNVCALDDRLCALSDTCAVHPVWIEVREEVRRVLAKRNFAHIKTAGAGTGTG